jgi:hypothetical protein
LATSTIMLLLTDPMAATSVNPRVINDPSAEDPPFDVK